MDRYTLLIDNAMISDKKGDWVHYKDAAARISELEAQLSAAQERNCWIPVTERLPRQLDVVDVQIRHGYQTDVMQNDGGDHWIDGEGNCWEAGTVTHWRYRL